MNHKTTTWLLAIVAAVAAQGAFAQDKAAAASKKYECYDEAVEPKPASTQKRAAVKGDIAGKAVSCYEAATAPAASSTKDRAAVKAETKAAMKAGELSQGEAGMTQKK